MNDAWMIVALSPVLAALMVGEAVLARVLGRKVHSTAQSLNNVFVAVGQRAVSAAVGFAPLAGYAWLADRVGVLTWDTGSALHWVLAFLAVDLAMYLRHLAGHRVAFLWAIHAVHHQSTEYNLTVATRLSWVQETVFFMVPLAVLGLPLAMVVPLFALGNLWQFVQHTELVGRLGWLDRVLMTPSNHRVHHGRNEAYLDTNYGNITLLWDRLFGTWVPETEPVVYGTLEGLPSHDPLENNLAPWRALVAKARRQPTWLEAAAVFVMPPGWRAAPSTFREPVPTDRIARCALGWLSAALVFAGSMGVTLGASAGLPVSALTLGCVGMLVLAGTALDGRSVRPVGTGLRAWVAALVETAAGASTDGPLAWLGRRLTPR